MSTKQTIGPKPGTARSANAKKKAIDANIRRIFEEEFNRGDSLRRALRYLFDNDKTLYVHAALKLIATKQTTNPIHHVTNIRTEQFNAQGVIRHMEELVILAEGANSPPPLQDESALLVSGDTEKE